ncbi:MAG: hypothetical protein CVU50_03550 [Candidatus Cloacimonetes bacterium HGW-Cloacimonetes-3]|jgi:uncharacterized membrane protein|nr:MAG: hypothetical protein CVU50_03550 [Candidatus Cloacimonetes bacterium HGW-Cloacimonetes-3]
MLKSLLLAIPFFRGDLTAKPVFVSTVILAVCITAFITWVVLMSYLVLMADGKKTRNWYLIWTFLIPYINILWVPWALISSNGFLKRAQQNYYKVNAYESAIGVQILSIPLLILYLFWSVIALILRTTIINQLQNIEMLLPIGIVVICILIVALIYLINLSVFVHKIRKYQHSHHQKR